ncbi:MAG: hypothetical protein KGK03_07265 [Candidatus Omnitrophica bacterium]|nr:hypothetical protein [Candidatus Omnitrophota bacterium]MDE2222853.1 hypothetical protein [Candidatus Omnitrophota bacterium]
MKKVLMGTLFAAFVLTGTGFAQTLPPDAPAPSAVMHKKMDRRHVRHPEIMRAVRKLKGARHDLQLAAHDFGGHRVKAIAAIDEALKQLHLAVLAADKK